MTPSTPKSPAFRTALQSFRAFRGSASVHGAAGIPAFIVYRLSFIVSALSLSSALAAPPAPPSPRASFGAALSDYATSNFTAAAEAFSLAASNAPAESLSPAQALFNQGLSLAMAGDPAAAEAFLQAARSPNAPVPLQARSFYNAGNLLLRQSIEQSQTPAVPDPSSAAAPAAPPIDASLQALANAIELDPGNIDAKASYELARQVQQQIQQQQQQQQSSEGQDQDQQENQDQQNEQNQQQDSDSRQQQQQQQSDGQDQDQQQQDQQQQDQQQQPSDSQSSRESPQPQNPEDAYEMTPEEAAQLLDSQKIREQSLRDQLRIQFGRPVPVEKDW